MKINFSVSFMAALSILVMWAALTFSLSLTEVSFGITCILVVIGLFQKKYALNDFDKPLLILLSVLLFWIFCSLSWTDFYKESFRGFFKYAEQFAVVVMAFFIFQESKYRKLFISVTVGVLVVLIANSITQYFTNSDFIRGFEYAAASSGRRITASMGNYGKLAAYVIMLTPILMMLLFKSLKEKQWRKCILWCSLTAGMLLVLFWTRSRGAFVAFGAGVFMLFLIRRWWIPIAALVLVGVLLFFSLPKSMVIHLDAEGKEQSLVERVYLWERAVNVIKARPVTGTGVNTYAKAHQAYDVRGNWRVRDYYAHNGFLQFGAELGLVGLGLLLSIFLRIAYLILRYLFKARDHSEHDLLFGLVGGMMTFLIFCMGDTLFHSSQPIMVFWFITGVALAISNQSLHKESTNLSDAAV